MIRSYVSGRAEFCEDDVKHGNGNFKQGNGNGNFKAIASAHDVNLDCTGEGGLESEMNKITKSKNCKFESKRSGKSHGKS